MSTSATTPLAGHELPRWAPPSLACVLMECRAPLEWLAGSAFVRWGKLGFHRPGAALVLPGYGMSDRSMRLVRRLLERCGYSVAGFGAGRHIGLSSTRREALIRSLHALHAAHGPVDLIGWSQGGVVVRELARRHPELCRSVVTLGSPIAGDPDANTVARIRHALARLRGQTPWHEAPEKFAARMPAPPLPCTAIASRSDGVVLWRCSQEAPAPNTANRQVRSSHFGLPCRPASLRALLAALAAPPGSSTH
jgi:pimeloyl-ACP methyl ester carboxylesterase